MKTEAEIRAAIDRVLIGGNHLASYSSEWPSWQLDGLTRAQQCENALRFLGATKDYDMWCCWSAIMQERDTLTGLFSPSASSPSDEEIVEAMLNKAHEIQQAGWEPGGPRVMRACLAVARQMLPAQQEARR